MAISSMILVIVRTHVGSDEVNERSMQEDKGGA
jgi:hypothetical protein